MINVSDIEKKLSQASNNLVKHSLNYNKNLASNLKEINSTTKNTTSIFKNLSKEIQIYLFNDKKRNNLNFKQFKEQFKNNQALINDSSLNNELLKKIANEQIDISKKEMALTSEKIKETQNIRGFSNFEKFQKQIQNIDKYLASFNVTEKMASKAKNDVGKKIKGDNNKIGFDIASRIKDVYKDNLSLSDILTTAGSAINSFVQQEMLAAKENKINHKDFIQSMNDRIKSEGIVVDIMKESVQKKVDLNNQEIASMEQRLDFWSKSDVIKYNSLLKEKKNNEILKKITDQSIERLKHEKQLSNDLKELSVDYAERLSDKLLSPISNIPIIGETLGKQLGDKLEKSLAPKFEKAFSKMLFKKGNAENGLDPVKVGGMLSSLATATVATAGLVLVVGGLVAIGYAFYKVFDSIVGKAGEFDKTAVKISQSLGAGYSQGYKLAQVVQDAYVNMSAFGVEQEVIAENARELYEDFKNVTIGNVEMLTKLTHGYGVATAAGGKLITGFEKIFGYSENSLDRFFSELQGQTNVAGISFKGVVEDISENWEEIVKSGGKNVKNIVNATIKSREMGNSLASVTKLRDSFKDLPSAFEKSAQLSFLTGQRVDAFSLFQKSQMGDLEGLQDVMLKNMTIFEKSMKKGKTFQDVPLVVKELWGDITGQSQEELAKMFSYIHKSHDEIEAMRKDTKDWDNALSNVSGLWDKIKDIAKNLYMQAISPLVGKVQQIFKGIRDGMSSDIMGKLGKSAEKFGGYFENAWESVSKIFAISKNATGTGFWGSIQNIITKISDTLQDFFVNKFDGIKTKFEHLLLKIKEVATSIWNILTDDNISIWEKLKSGLSTLFTDLVNPIASMLRKAIFKTSPGLASALGISGVDIARENAAIDYDNSKTDPVKKGKLFSEAWDELNIVKDIVRPAPFADARFTKSGDDSNLQKFRELADKYSIEGVDNAKIEKLIEVLEGKLRTYEDYDKDFNLSKMQYGPEAPMGQFSNQKFLSDYESKTISQEQIKSLKIPQEQIFAIQKASGGMITGPGTSTSDSIPARLSDGEFVVNAKSTAQYRPVLEAMNKNKFADGTPPTSSQNIFNKILSTLQIGLGTRSKSYLHIISEYFDSRLKAYKSEQITDYNISKTAASFGNMDETIEKATSKKTFAHGGMLEGPSHTKGGIPARVGGKGFVELEGGEAIINKRSMQIPGLRKLASMINTFKGGKKFAQGGSIDNIASRGGFVEFANALAQRESGGKQDIVNKYGYMGLYQFGKSTLKTLGIDTNKEKFLKDKSLQDEALKRNIEYHIGPKDRFGFGKYYGKNMYGTVVTPSGVYGAAHLKGAGGAKKLLKGQDNKDAFGTRASEYLSKFRDYDLTNYSYDNNTIKKARKIATPKRNLLFGMFGDGGVIGSTISEFPKPGDQGKVDFKGDSLVHNVEHLSAHVGAEKLLHKIGGKMIGTVLAKAISFSGNLFDPTNVHAGTKTPEMIAEEIQSIQSTTPYGPEKLIGPELPKRKSKKKKYEYGGVIKNIIDSQNNNKISTYAKGGLIEPIAKTSLVGINNFLEKRIGQGLVKKNQESIQTDQSEFGPTYNESSLRRIGGNETDHKKTWAGVGNNIKKMWSTIASKFPGSDPYISDAMRHSPVGRGSGGQHQAGLAIDIGSAHARGASQNAPAPIGTLDNVSKFIGSRFNLPPSPSYATSGHPKGQLLWRTGKGGNHFDHIHVSLRDNVNFKHGGYIKAADGMEAIIDGPTEMSLGGKKILTGDNASGKESVQIQSKENKDEELKLRKEANELLRQLVNISKKNGNMKIFIDGKESANSIIKHIVQEVVN